MRFQGSTSEIATALIGAAGPSASTARRQVATWHEQHERWQRRDLGTRRYVHVRADGAYFRPRLDHDRQCMLALIGADACCRNELPACQDFPAEP